MPVLILISLVLYFAPTLAALGRSHRQALAIGLLNLFLGWTVVGWVAAIVWAVTNPPAPVVIYQPGPAPQPPADR
jgi:hypothetical protein